MKKEEVMPRRLALKTLKKIYASGQYSNIAVDKMLESSDMSPADRGLFTAITMGVIEHKLTLDYYIQRLADSPDKTDDNTRIILYIGLYQLMYLDRIPEYAAINETVDLCPRRTRGFVNAILRSYLRQKNSIELPDREADTIEYLSVKYSFPRELCKRFVNIFGEERAERIFEIYNLAPDMTLRVNTLKISRDAYASLLSGSGIEYEYTKNSPVGIHVRGASFASLPKADEGCFFVQDEASQICVEATGVKAKDVLVDCCSCPGSKSFGCGIKMNNTGKILSCDLHGSKLSLVRDGAERLGIDIISVREADARKVIGELVGSADVLLCDVPCSGFGVVGKKPEIRYKDLSESDKLPKIQGDILENVSKYVKVGGVIVYSTCTLFPEENECVVDSFISRHPEFVFEDFSVGEIHSADGKLTLTPDIHKTDGFFIAKMRRI